MTGGESASERAARRWRESQAQDSTTKGEAPNVDKSPLSEAAPGEWLVVSAFDARAREAALDDAVGEPDEHINHALNRLARGSSFETRSTPPRGRESPSRINEFRLARLMLDNAIAALGPADSK